MWLLALFACGPNLAPGQWGPLRYFADIRGDTPMRLIPPITDRMGNHYVLYGALDRTDTEVFVGPFEGSWSGGCPAHRGLGGLHGWVGRAESRAWFWAGDALVEVDGTTGACREVFDDDPLSGTELFFRGVVPSVDETPSQRSVTALVASGAGTSQLIRVDLDARLPLAADPLPFDDLQNIEVLGTGAWEAFRYGVFIVRADGAEHALFVDRQGRVLGAVDVAWPPTATRVLGFVNFTSDGPGMGLLDDGSLLVVNGQSTTITATNGFTPAGVQPWNNRLWVTGATESGPVLAPVLADGTLGDLIEFTASIQAAANLEGTLQVRDERSSPALVGTWSDTTTAIGSWPLLSPWALEAYTTNSTSWLVAGPGYQGPIESVNAVAFGPVGVSFP